MSQTLRRYLDERAVRYELVGREPVQHGDGRTASIRVDAARLAKSILIEAEQRYMLVVIPAGHHLELGSLHRRLGAHCGIATPAEIEELFGDCADGALPATGQAYGVSVLLDDALLAATDVYFQAGDREQLVHMTGPNFRRLMNGVPHGRFSVHAPRRMS